MNRTFRSITLGLLASALALPAAALADGDEDASNEDVKEFFECFNTPAGWYPGTIVEAALATEDLSTLADLVVAADLVELLSGEGPFTVYAPLNSAFANIPESVLGAIGSDVEILRTVLGYHVTDRANFFTDPRRVFDKIEQVTTLIGQDVFFSRDDEGTEINNSNLVSCQRIWTTNGVVYLIDSVLLPQF